MLMRSGPAFLLLALAFSACLQEPSAQTTPAAPASAAGGYYPPVNSTRLPTPGVDFATIAGFRYGLDVVGENRLYPSGAPPSLPGNARVPGSASHIAIDTWHEFVCVADFSFGPGGAIIIDIKDPTKPRVLSSVDSGMTNSDCQFTDDGNFLLVAAYTGIHPGIPGAPPPVGDLMAEGVLVFDVKDKARPRFLFHDSQGAGRDGYHNVFTAQISGTHYVFQTYTGHILALDPGATKLRMVSTVDIADHDMWVGRHAITGEWVMITGAGQGVRVYNVDDPAKPRQLGEWGGTGRFTGWHRQWPLMNTVEGRALMVVAGEEGYSSGNPTYYTVLDYTDPTDLIELGHWSIPRGGATQHEFEIFDGYVASGNYGSGIWLFDVGTLERARSPATLGFFQPNDGRGSTWGGYFDERGYVVTADSGTGLYVLKFGATLG